MLNNRWRRRTSSRDGISPENPFAVPESASNERETQMKEVAERKARSESLATMVTVLFSLLSQEVQKSAGLAVPLRLDAVII